MEYVFSTDIARLLSLSGWRYITFRAMLLLETRILTSYPVTGAQIAYFTLYKMEGLRYQRWKSVLIRCVWAWGYFT